MALSDGLARHSDGVTFRWTLGGQSGAIQEAESTHLQGAFFQSFQAALDDSRRVSWPSRSRYSSTSGSSQKVLETTTWPPDSNPSGSEIL